MKQNRSKEYILNEKVQEQLNKLLKEYDYDCLFNISKYGICLKKYNKNNAKFFNLLPSVLDKMHSKFYTIYYYLNHNNWNLITYPSDNDKNIQNDTLKYALQTVGAIYSIEFTDICPTFTYHVNLDFVEKYGGLIDNYFKSSDYHSKGLYWITNITDFFNLYYVYFYKKMKTKKIYLNVFDHPIYPRKNIHPFECFQNNNIPIKIQTTVFPDIKFPIYSFSSHIEYNDITLPMPDICMFLLEREFFYNFDINSIPSFENKKCDKVIFRGTYTSYKNDLTKDIRLQAHLKSLKYPEVLDIISLPKPFILYNDLMLQEKQEIPDLSMSNYLSIEKQLEYKYLLHLDGVSSSWRIIRELYYNSLIIIPETPFTDVIRDSLVKNSHYIEVKRDLSNLINTVYFLHNNNNINKIIIENVNELKKILMNFRIHFDLAFEKIENKSNEYNYFNIKQYPIVPNNIPEIENEDNINWDKTNKIYFVDIKTNLQKYMEILY